MKYWIAVFASVVLLTGCDKPVEQVHLSGGTMGTTYNVKYLTDVESLPDEDQVHQEIDRLLEKVNDQMSTYRKTSELSRFNQSTSVEPFTVSPEMITVVKEAVRLNKVTEGKLDVTVGPLVNLWGFGPEARPEIIPTEDELAARRKEVGIHHLTIGDTFLQKDIPGLYVDLSTIAKGWGVDVVTNYLSSLGLKNVMVEIGGEIHTLGHNKEGVKWRIAIEKPTVDERSIQEIIEPGDMGVATSGDYRNYFEEDGVRFSHIIDPDTGRPINNKVVSVTVLAPTTMTADGLATGLMVLGEEEGMRIAEANHIPAFIIVKTADGFKEYASSTFKPYLQH